MRASPDASRRYEPTFAALLPAAASRRPSLSLLVGKVHLRRPHSAGEDEGFAALSRFEMAVTTCAGAKGLVNRTLFGRPLEGQSSPWVPVI